MRLRKIINRKDKQRRRIKFKRKCFFEKYKIEHIDYKNTIILNFFLTKRKQILPKRIVHTCAKKQRQLAKAVKLARLMGLISYKEVLKNK